MPSSVRRVSLVVLVSAGIFVSLNAGYIASHIRFFFAAPSASTSTVEAVRAEAPNRLRIPSLGIEAPVIEPDEASEAAYQRALSDGVVHFPGTAFPGSYGNAYIFGHSSDYPWTQGSYKTVFALLTRIRIGATIEVTDAAGTPFRYDVRETRIVAPDDLSVLDQHGYQERLLTLQTSYPLGTALKRFIVVAVLVE